MGASHPRAAGVWLTEQFAACARSTTSLNGMLAQEKSESEASDDDNQLEDESEEE